MPLRISLEDIGKRYAKQRVLHNITYTFSAPGKYAVLGANGSGKSTLLRIIAGMQAPGEGSLLFEKDSRPIAPAEIFGHVSFCAPGIDLPAELTLRELIAFHFTFKKLQAGILPKDVPDLLTLDAFRDKPVSDFSSGMRQRVKLGLAFFADTPLLLLDEPCSNLDASGVAQYEAWMDRHTKGRLTIVASNERREWEMCDDQLVLDVTQ